MQKKISWKLDIIKKTVIRKEMGLLLEITKLTDKDD